MPCHLFMPCNLQGSRRTWKWDLSGHDRELQAPCHKLGARLDRCSTWTWHVGLGSGQLMLWVLLGMGSLPCTPYKPCKSHCMSCMAVACIKLSPQL